MTLEEKLEAGLTTGKMFKWTVEISVDAIWVADGYNLHQDRADTMADNLLSWASEGEVTCKVIGSPDAEEIAKMMGYSNAEDMHKCNADSGINSRPS